MGRSECIHVVARGTVFEVFTTATWPDEDLPKQEPSP